MCLCKSEAGKERVAYRGTLPAKAEVVKQHRKRATDDRKLGFTEGKCKVG